MKGSTSDLRVIYLPRPKEGKPEKLRNVKYVRMADYITRSKIPSVQCPIHLHDPMRMPLAPSPREVLTHHSASQCPKILPPQTPCNPSSFVTSTPSLRLRLVLAHCYWFVVIVFANGLARSSIAPRASSTYRRRSKGKGKQKNLAIFTTCG